MMQERLQEEKMERVKLEVELGREKDCNRVSEHQRDCVFFQCIKHLVTKRPLKRDMNKGVSEEKRDPFGAL